MLAHFLSSTFRNLWSRRIHTLITILSLALGLTVFAFAFLYVKKEVSYDRAWPDAGRIHRLLVEQQGVPGLSDGVLAYADPHLSNTLPDYFQGQIAAISRLQASGGFRTVLPAGEGDGQFMGITYVDPAFTDIFRLEIVSGNLAYVLTTPGLLAFEEAEAERLVGKDPLGKRIRVRRGRDTEIEYEVGAIYRVPEPVSKPFRVLAGLHDDVLVQSQVEIWLTLQEGISTDAFNAQQSAFVEQYVTRYNDRLATGDSITNHLRYRFQRITDMHFYPSDLESLDGLERPGRVATIAVAGMLVLLVGCSNSMSLSLAAVLERRREIGIRKASGASQLDIFLQYLGESILLALLSLCIALVLLELLLPSFISLLNILLPPVPDIIDYLVLAGIASVVGLVNGIYPAMVLAGVKPQSVLKPGVAGGVRGAQSLRTWLVGVQFSLALVLLIGTLSLYAQLTALRQQPLGFNPENILMIYGPVQAGQTREVISQEILALPGVTTAIPILQRPFQNVPLSIGANSLFRQGDTLEIKASSLDVHFQFFSLMEMPLIAGRAYDPARDSRDAPSDRFPDQGQDDTTLFRTILNRTAARALGFENAVDAVNQRIVQRTLNPNGSSAENVSGVDNLVEIIGVVEDSMYASLRRRPTPEIYRLIDFPVARPALFVKYEDAVEGTIRQRVESTWQKLAGAPPTSSQFIEAGIATAFSKERNESRLLLICAGIAIFLSSIGLYGLAAFAMERNVKEVGVRKVLGASVGAIVGLFLWRFARPVLLANIVAWPVAVYFVLQWIEQFPYQLDKMWLLPLCLGAALGVLAIALLTISIITTRSALQRPVHSLRYE